MANLFADHDETLYLRRWLVKGERHSHLRLVVIGQPSQGKSSLIGGLLRKDVALRRLLKPEPHRVEFTFENSEFSITLWDTPGLIGTARVQKELLQSVKEECSPFDLLLYCVRMGHSQWRIAIDKATICRITEVFGREIWHNCLFVLTFANEAAEEYQGSDVGRYISEREQSYNLKLKEALKNHTGLPDEDINQLWVVHVGNPRASYAQCLPRRRDWIQQFWLKCTLAIDYSTHSSCIDEPDTPQDESKADCCLR